MLNTYQKISKLILIFLVVISGWTSILLMSNTSYNLEIIELLEKMYLNQKKFIFNVKDLSHILIKDANERFSDNKSAK